MSEPSTSSATTDVGASATVCVTAVRWRPEDAAMTEAAATILLPTHGTVIAQCKACPPKPAFAKNIMLGSTVTGMLPRESWMLVIKFDTITDADTWAASTSQYFDLIHCVPGV